MRNRNVWIIVGVMAAIALVLVLSQVLPRNAAPSADAPNLASPEATAASTASPSVTDATSPVTVTPEQSTAAPEATEAGQAPVAYLLVTAGNVVYQPVPLTKETDYTVTQANGAVNKIHVTTDSVMMSSATCENQDCVEQGTVTLENKGNRVLGNMIICLPNQVQLELYTADEMAKLMAGE